MATDHSPSRIVLIEDNIFDAQLMRHAFAQLHKAYHLDVLANIEEVSRFLRNSVLEDSPAPCLIILDLHLPKADGITILQELRSNPVLSEVPVVVLSTIASPREMRQVLEMGVRMYRTKPMDWNETVRLASELLEVCHEPHSVAA